MQVWEGWKWKIEPGWGCTWPKRVQWKWRKAFCKGQSYTWHMTSGYLRWIGWNQLIAKMSIQGTGWQHLLLHLSGTRRGRSPTPNRRDSRWEEGGGEMAILHLQMPTLPRWAAQWAVESTADLTCPFEWLDCPGETSANDQVPLCQCSYCDSIHGRVECICSGALFSARWRKPHHLVILLLNQRWYLPQRWYLSCSPFHCSLSIAKL